MPERIVYLIRHAKAQSRAAWTEPDHLRPLNERGRRQAESIADDLSEIAITEVRTSPAVRCVQTIEPLCNRLGLDPIVDGALMEGTSIELPHHPGVHVYCAHGDNIPAALEALNVDWENCKKGSAYRLTFSDGGGLTDVEYVEYAA